MQHHQQLAAQPITVQPITVDVKRRTVWVNGRLIKPHLTRLEFNLISFLLKKADEACSRDELASHLYQDDILSEDGVTDTRIDSLVKRLRRRIESDPKNPRYLQTVRGVGFRQINQTEDNEPLSLENKGVIKI